MEIFTPLHPIRLKKLKRYIKSLKPIGYWPLWETSGGVAKNYAPANLGSLNGTTIGNGTTVGQPGLVGKAYSFDGTDTAKVTIPYDSKFDFTGNQLGLFAIIYMNALPSASAKQFMIIKHLKSTPDGGYQMEINGTSGDPNQVRLVVRGPDDTFSSGNGITLEANKWYAIAATYDGVNLRTYVNGVLSVEDDSTGNLLPNTQDLLIGGEITNGDHHDGLIQHAAVFDKVLSDDQILKLAQIAGVT